MGHLLSRAIKRFTQCNSSSRNQLAGSNQSEASNQEQQSTTERGQNLERPCRETIPVGQSIDSAEFAACETAPSSVDKISEDALATTSHNNEQLDRPAETKDDNRGNVNGPDVSGDELTQNRSQVEEAVIKIQALVRGHLTRKALKDAHHQPVPLNVLGQSQFDEESLRNPPNVLFSNVSSPQPSTNTPNLADAIDHQQQQLQSSGKLGNGRVPPLESIAEDVESINATASSSRVRRKLSSPKSRPANSASETSGESVESQSTSPSNEANASIDIHSGTPTSASIDIMDHSNRPLAAIASVLHPQTTTRPLVEAESAAAPAVADQSDQQLQNGSSRMDSSMSMLLNDQVHPMSASSVPSTPPHINLALTTNSHSIDSAEAAAIRIQSAFRGYHTRKHSPYRRRSPGYIGSSPVSLINGATSNGQLKRNTLRQQNATILDDEDLTSGQDQAMVDECLNDALSSEETEESRQSRLRHRLDEVPTDGLPQAIIGGTTAPTSLDELIFATVEDDQTLTMNTKEVQPGESAPASGFISSNITNRANLIRAEPNQQSQDKSLPAKSDRRTDAFSLNTDSSNLGAALSLNEDPLEGLSQSSVGGDAQPVALKRDSIGAALESSGEDASADMDAVSREQAVRKQLEELDRVADQLEAALDEATDNEALTYGDESQQNLNELESDDVERRHPSGFVDLTSRGSQDHGQEAALVGSNSLDDQEVDVRNEQRLAQLDIPQARLEAISPDEAIGSGGSSPALVDSHDGNSTDDGADSDQEQNGQQQDGCMMRADNQQSGSGANRGGKKRRNRRRGKK